MEMQKTTTYELHDFADGCGRVPANRHPNGGGWVAETAHVGDTAYVGLRARVSGYAQVSGDATEAPKEDGGRIAELE